LSQLSSILRKKQTSTRIQLQQPLPQTYVQELPKIDEDNEEENDESAKELPNIQVLTTNNEALQIKNSKKRDTPASSSSNFKPAPFIQMTKTARLRFDKLSQTKYITLDSSQALCKKQAIIDSNLHPKTVYTKFLVKENLNTENKHPPLKNPSVKQPLWSSNTTTNAHSKLKQQTHKKASFSNLNTNIKQTNSSSNSKNSTDSSTENKPISNSSTKVNTVLTTVNFHSNTFNFNYRN
jgi:hypothetical protein